jgi:hypothetical protein
MLEDMKPPPRAGSCAVRTVLDSLDESDRIILVDALSTPITVWGHVPLSEALKQRGIVLLETAIRKHRAARCSCERVMVE